MAKQGGAEPGGALKGGTMTRSWMWWKMGSQQREVSWPERGAAKLLLSCLVLDGGGVNVGLGRPKRRPQEEMSRAWRRFEVCEDKGQAGVERCSKPLPQADPIATRGKAARLATKR